MSLRVETVNLDFTAGGDGDFLAALCERNEVLLVQEAKNVDLARVLPEGWVALQDRRDPGRAGSAICYDERYVAASDLVLRLGTRPWLGRRRAKMLTRWIATAHLTEIDGGEHFYFVSAHPPPPRYSWLQPAMNRRLRRLARHHPRIVLGVDANQPIDRLAKSLGLTAHGVGIIGVLTGPKVRGRAEHVSTWGKRHDYTDHQTVAITISNRR